MPNDCPARDWGYTSAGASSTSTVVASGLKVSPGKAVGFSFGFLRRPVVLMRRWIEEAQSPKCCVSRPRTGRSPAGERCYRPVQERVWCGRAAGFARRPPTPNRFPLIRGKLFLVGAGRAKPGQHPPKTLFRHGARTPASRQGAVPSAAEVRLNFVRHPVSFVQTPVRWAVCVWRSIYLPAKTLL